MSRSATGGRPSTDQDQPQESGHDGQRYGPETAASAELDQSFGGPAVRDYLRQRTDMGLPGAEELRASVEALARAGVSFPPPAGRIGLNLAREAAEAEVVRQAQAAAGAAPRVGRWR